MPLCTCKQCRYIFRYPLLPSRCPDCGAEAVRKATDAEVQEYRRMQEILREEIRLGIWP